MTKSYWAAYPPPVFDSWPFGVASLHRVDRFNLNAGETHARHAY